MPKSDDYRHALPMGSMLEEYRLERVLGSGTFGVTYLARDTRTEMAVAIKEYFPVELVMRQGKTVVPRGSTDEEVYRWGLDRFLSEARVLAKFRHPNIVSVMRFIEGHGTAYLVMPYEEGESLFELLRAGERPGEADLRRMTLQLMDGLEQVHRVGFLHRDIKPANIFIRKRDESPILLDFGAARQAIGKKSRNLTQIYTPGFAPFEQYFESGEQGRWTDIYALGAVLYWAMSGETPPEAPARQNAKLRGQPDPLRPARVVGKGRYSESFLRAIDHALQVLETERPQSVAEWRREFEGQIPPAPSPPPRVEKAVSPPQPKVSSRKQWLVVGLLVLLWAIWPKNEETRLERQRLAEQTRALEEEKRRLADGQRRAAAAKARPAVQEAVSGKTWRDPVTGMEFIFIPEGCFEMGSPGSENGHEGDEGPVHEVCLDGFWLGKYEVTNGQYRQHKKGYSSGDYEGKSLNGEDQPVVMVNWQEAVDYGNWLSGKGNGTFRLPTEAEWEYAARGGTKTARYWGGNSDEACAYANVHDLTSKRANKEFTWEHHKCDDGNAVTSPVGKFKPNKFGLYDMLGNVWEWTSDWYGENYYASSSKENPTGPTGGSSRVFRGGGWNNNPARVRSANRHGDGPGGRHDSLGFRLARTNP